MTGKNMTGKNHMSFEELFINDWTNFCNRFNEINSISFEEEKTKQIQSLFKEMNDKIWYTPGSLSPTNQGEILKSTISTNNIRLIKRLLRKFPDIIKYNRNSIDIKCVLFQSPEIFKIILNECGKKHVVKSLIKTKAMWNIIGSITHKSKLLSNTDEVLQTLYQCDLLEDLLDVDIRELTKLRNLDVDKSSKQVTAVNLLSYLMKMYPSKMSHKTKYGVIQPLRLKIQQAIDETDAIDEIYELSMLKKHPEQFADIWNHLCKQIIRQNNRTFVNEYYEDIYYEEGIQIFDDDRDTKIQALFKKLDKTLLNAPNSIPIKGQIQIVEYTFDTENKKIMIKLLTRFPNIIKNSYASIYMDINYLSDHEGIEVLEKVIEQCGSKYIVASLARDEVIKKVILSMVGKPQYSQYSCNIDKILEALYRYDALEEILNNFIEVEKGIKRFIGEYDLAQEQVSHNDELEGRDYSITNFLSYLMNNYGDRISNETKDRVMKPFISKQTYKEEIGKLFDQNKEFLNQMHKILDETDAIDEVSMLKEHHEKFAGFWSHICKQFTRENEMLFYDRRAELCGIRSSKDTLKDRETKIQALLKKFDETLLNAPNSLSSTEQREILKSTISTNNSRLIKRLLSKFPDIIKDNKENIDIEYCARSQNFKILQIITNECGKKYIAKSLAETCIINNIIFPDNKTLLNPRIRTLINLYKNDLLEDVLNIWAEEQEIFDTKGKKTINDILNKVCNTCYVDESAVKKVIKILISQVQNDSLEKHYNEAINESLQMSLEILDQAQAEDYYNAAIDTTLVEVLAEVQTDNN